MALPKTETFTNSDGTVLTTHDANWANNSGGFVINTNNVAPNASGAESGARWNGDTFNANHSAQLTVTAITGTQFLGVGCRHAAAGTASYYLYYGDNGSQYFGKIVTGTYTDLQSSLGIGVIVTDVLYIEAVGTTITAKKNGSNAFSPATDSALSGGAAGLTGFGQSTAARGDTWIGSDIGGGGGAVTPQLMLMGVGD